MKNFNNFNEYKQNVKYKIKKGAVITGFALLPITITSCGHNNEEHLNVTQTVNALSEKEGLTYVDEYLKASDIEGLDKDFQAAYIEYNHDKCNDILCEISSVIIKALVAESFDINIADIEDFEILGKMFHDKDADIGYYSNPEYGVHFKYKGKSVNYETPKGYIIRDIVVIQRAALQNELTLNKNNTSFPELLYIPAAYEKLSEVLKTTLKYDNKKHTDMHDNNKEGYHFNGYIKSKVNRKKSKAIKKQQKQINRKKSKAIREYQNKKVQTLNKAKRRR